MNYANYFYYIWEVGVFLFGKLACFYLGSWRNLLHHERIGLFHILNIYEFSWEGVRLPYQIIFLPKLILCSSLYLFCCAIQAIFIKKIQAKDRQCG